jgi:hypothetical protein
MVCRIWAVESSFVPSATLTAGIVWSAEPPRASGLKRATTAEAKALPETARKSRRDNLVILITNQANGIILLNRECSIKIVIWSIEELTGSPSDSN